MMWSKYLSTPNTWGPIESQKTTTSWFPDWDDNLFDEPYGKFLQISDGSHWAEQS